jgi:hypothetical protein
LLLVATNLKQWNMQQLPTFRDIYRISPSAAAPWTTNRSAQRAGRRSTTEYHLTRKEDFFKKIIIFKINVDVKYFQEYTSAAVSYDG